MRFPVWIIYKFANHFWWSRRWRWAGALEGWADRRLWPEPEDG